MLRAAGKGSFRTMDYRLDLTEDERQMVLMAMAHLAVERPGWAQRFYLLALQIDDQRDGRPLMFDEFKKLHKAACGLKG